MEFREVIGYVITGYVRTFIITSTLLLITMGTRFPPHPHVDDNLHPQNYAWNSCFTFLFCNETSQCIWSSYDDYMLSDDMNPLIHEIVSTSRTSDAPQHQRVSVYKIYCIRNIMMTSSAENIFRVTGHLCGEFTGPRWISRTKASYGELWRLNKRLSNQPWGWWYDTLSCPLWRHCNVLWSSSLCWYRCSALQCLRCFQ